MWFGRGEEREKKRKVRLADYTLTGSGDCEAKRCGHVKSNEVSIINRSELIELMG